MRRGAVLGAVLAVLALGGCGGGDGDQAAAPTPEVGVPSAESDPTVGELDRTVTYVEQLLDDTEREMAADPTS